jgi:3-oxoacyl-[acyl-carrier protein] reductase
VVNDVDASSAADAVRSIEDAGGTAVAHIGAIGDSDVADQLVATAVEGFGRLDVMVTNAGILRDRTLWNMSDEEFDAVVAVHLRGTFTCARSAARYFRDAGHGGRLILVGSPAGQRGNFGQTNYAACKAGITAFARTWAMELARADVTVNCIVPTAATEMTRTIPAFAAHIDAMELGTPLPNWMRQEQAIGTPREVAPLVVFLASDASAAITGQTIGLGGDRLAVWAYPEEAGVTLKGGGWDAESIAGEFQGKMGEILQPYGIVMPKDPNAADE